MRAELAGVRSDLRSELHRLHNQTLTAIIAVAGVMTTVLAIVN